MGEFDELDFPIAGTATAGEGEKEAKIRASRSKRRAERPAKRDQHDKPVTRQSARAPVAKPSGGEGSQAVNPTIDPLVTYCSLELRDAQAADKSIAAIKTLLRENPNKKPKACEITQYGCTVKALWAKWGELRIRDDILYREDQDLLGNARMRYVVPETLRRPFFLALHDTPLSAHQGIGRTVKHLRGRYHWPGMLRDVTQWCAQCYTCMKTKRLPINRKAELQRS